MTFYVIYCDNIIGTEAYWAEEDAINACKIRTLLYGREWKYRMCFLATGLD